MTRLLMEVVDFLYASEGPILPGVYGVRGVAGKDAAKAVGGAVRLA